jgi:hypothetical protein
MKTIRVKDFEMWNMSISLLWGKSPKVSLICGKCSYTFSKRFELIALKHRNPKVLCPCCNTRNYIPIVQEE